MFDRYIVCEESLRARDDGRPGGVVEVRMPYYRGLTLSMVEAVDVTVDAAPVAADRTTFTVHGNTYTFDVLPTVTDDRWEMGERAALAFETDEPLTPGEHDVAVVVRLRISYMPVPGGGRDSKRLTLTTSPRMVRPDRGSDIRPHRGAGERGATSAVAVDVPRFGAFSDRNGRLDARHLG